MHVCFLFHCLIGYNINGTWRDRLVTRPLKPKSPWMCRTLKSGMWKTCGRHWLCISASRPQAMWWWFTAIEKIPYLHSIPQENFWYQLCGSLIQTPLWRLRTYLHFLPMKRFLDFHNTLKSKFAQSDFHFIENRPNLVATDNLESKILNWLVCVYISCGTIENRLT